MSRRSKGSVLDISIRGDELENNRIQLENNLQHTDLSFRLSSASEDEAYNHNHSVEYPRHNAAPTTFPDFASFERRSRDHFDDETHSQIHPWSYRTGEDEEGINPFGGETFSTAAHHASALTLSAGLGGGRGARRDISLSGAEYDPDRPLRDMIDGVDSKISAFDLEPSRSKYPGVGSVTLDPLVVDNTAELDRVLQSGYAPAFGSQPLHVLSPLHSSSSSSASDSESARPKITDALRRVSFSPKRPRSAQSNQADRYHPVPSPLANPLPNPNPSVSYNMPTPRPAKRSSIFPSHPSSSSTAAISNPQVRIQPPTPSTAGSKFSKMARGLTKEIKEEQHAHNRAESSRPASAPAGDKNPFDPRKSTSIKPTSRSHQTSRGRVHLPDVTGLTSAVESPAKLGLEYYSYRGEDVPREIEARLLRTLSTVQKKLQHLEQENGISRRRVRELEMELEVCKRDVARERTRVLEREETIVQQRRDASYIAASKRHKGKARAKDVSMEGELHERYREAVEEKKALESLITSLRTHLARLTSELSTHQELLTELRSLRDSDSRMLQQKTAEIERLREEVEKLAGEVEVLRGVVEEGLKERRAVRDVSIVQSAADLAMSADLESDSDEYEETEFGADRSGFHAVEEQAGEGTGDYEIEDDEPEPFDPQSIQNRTDHATLGSSHLGTTGGGPVVTSEELDRISVEVEERRQAQHIQPPSPSPVQATRRVRRATVEDVVDEEAGRNVDRPQSPPPSNANPSSRFTRSVRDPPQASTSRLPVPISVQAPSNNTCHSRAPNPIETPFPQIRGAHLERLFFSAPEHNARTCTMCRRRRHRPDTSSSWIPSRFRGAGAENTDDETDNEAEETDEDEDEGFVEGSDQPDHQTAGVKKLNGKQREHVGFSREPGPWRQQAQREGLPPQTVVARVIRELEDDFTHYKSVYVELADQYKDMDPVSDVPKRNMLAQHLREVVDILEQKGDQIASLYDLLSFKDKPVSESIVPINTRPTHAGTSSWGKSGLRRHPTALI